MRETGRRRIRGLLTVLKDESRLKEEADREVQQLPRGATTAAAVMLLSRLAPAALSLLRQVDLTVVLQQLSSTFFDTALLMVVKDRYANSSYPGLSREDSQQRAMSNFYMIYNLIVKLTPILPALLLARLGDRGWRKAPIVVSLSGYLLARLSLLLVLLLHLPLEVMFGVVVVFELGGGFCAFWSGVMTLLSVSTTTEERSQVGAGPRLLVGGRAKEMFFTLFLHV